MNFPRAPGLPGQPQQPQDPNEANMKMMASMMESCYAKTVMAGVAGMGLGAVFGMFMASMAYDTPYHTITPESTAAKPAATTTGSAPAAAAATKPHPAVPNATPGATTTTAAAATTGTAATAAGSSAAKQTAAPTVKPPSAILSRVAATEAAAAATAAPSSAAATTSAAMTPMGAAAAAASGSVPVTSLPLRKQLAVGFKDMGARSWSTGKNFMKVGALFSGIECGIEGLRAKNDAANGIGAGCIAGAVLARNGGPQAAAIGCVGFAAFSAAIEAWLRSPKDE